MGASFHCSTELFSRARDIYIEQKSLQEPMCVAYLSFNGKDRKRQGVYRFATNEIIRMAKNMGMAG